MQLKILPWGRDYSHCAVRYCGIFLASAPVAGWSGGLQVVSLGSAVRVYNVLKTQPIRLVL
jgi:hypothetical protein